MVQMPLLGTCNSCAHEYQNVEGQDGQTEVQQNGVFRFDEPLESSVDGEHGKQCHTYMTQHTGQLGDRG